jgi:hypothetical protein
MEEYLSEEYLNLFKQVSEPNVNEMRDMEQTLRSQDNPLRAPQNIQWNQNPTVQNNPPQMLREVQQYQDYPMLRETPTYDIPQPQRLNETPVYQDYPKMNEVFQTEVRINGQVQQPVTEQYQGRTEEKLHPLNEEVSFEGEVVSVAQFNMSNVRMFETLAYKSLGVRL